MSSSLCGGLFELRHMRLRRVIQMMILKSPRESVGNGSESRLVTNRCTQMLCRFANGKGQRQILDHTENM
jgi:hypothetical protein